MEKGQRDMTILASLLTAFITLAIVLLFIIIYR